MASPVLLGARPGEVVAVTRGHRPEPRQDQRRLRTALAVVARLEREHAVNVAARERAGLDDVEVREACRRSHEALLTAYRKVRTLQQRTEGR